MREVPPRMVLPSLITVLAICAGLSAIRLAFDSHFEAAVSLILVACLLDGIDGRLACAACRDMNCKIRCDAQIDRLMDGCLAARSFISHHPIMFAF
jgi:CDP-diacylglycerol--serine O-phosphatidyltransferase